MPIRTKVFVEAHAEKFKASYATFEKYRTIANDVMELLAEHLLGARQAALRHGFAGAVETLQ